MGRWYAVIGFAIVAIYVAIIVGEGVHSRLGVLPWVTLNGGDRDHRACCGPHQRSACRQELGVLRCALVRGARCRDDEFRDGDMGWSGSISPVRPWSAWTIRR